MLLDDVYVVSDARALATDAQIAEAETALGARVPAGYRAYMMTLGAGELNETVRVLPPDELVRRTRDFRGVQANLTAGAEEDGYSRWDLFDASLALLPPDRLLSSVLVIDAGEGDEIVYHPDAPGDLFLLPHEDGTVVRVGGTLDEALARVLGDAQRGVRTRVLTAAEVFEDRDGGFSYFEPDPARERLMLTLNRAVPFAEVRAVLQAEALRHAPASLLVSEAYTHPDGRPGEILRLFVRAYGGAIWCHQGLPDGAGITVHLSYDRRRRTRDVDRLLAFCRGRTRRRAPWWRLGRGR